MRRKVFFASLFAAGSLAAVGQDIRRPIVNAEFGRVGDTSVQIYTLTNAHGIEARIMTYGATLVSLKRLAMGTEATCAGAQWARLVVAPKCRV